MSNNYLYFKRSFVNAKTSSTIKAFCVLTKPAAVYMYHISVRSIAYTKVFQTKSPLYIKIIYQLLCQPINMENSLWQVYWVEQITTTRFSTVNESHNEDIVLPTRGIRNIAPNLNSCRMVYTSCVVSLLSKGFIPMHI